MNIGEFLGGVDTFDLLVFLALFGGFVLGFIQGTIRRLLGIGSMLFSFVLAANLKEPVGGFLAANWTQWPSQYASMIGFLTMFVAAVIAFTIVIQGTYRPAPLFAKYRFVDEVLGGLLGVFQVAMLLTFVTIVLDSFFLFRGIPAQGNELPLLRGFWEALDGSGTGTWLHGTLIPGILSVAGFLVPESIRALYAGT